MKKSSQHQNINEYICGKKKSSNAIDCYETACATVYFTNLWFRQEVSGTHFIPQ